jgi:hypothetical protein
MQQFKYTSNTCVNQCFHKYAIVYWKYANPCFQVFGRPPGRVIGGPGIKLGQYLAPGTCGILHPWVNLVGLKSFENILKTGSVWEICCKYTNPYWKIQQLNYTLNRYANQCFQNYAIVYWKYASPCFQEFGRPPGRVIWGPGNELGQYVAPGTCGILHQWLNPYGLTCFENILKIGSVLEICWTYGNSCWQMQHLNWSIHWTNVPIYVF